jgi:hypothetical protein
MTANEKRETDKTLKEFGNCCRALCEVLLNSKPLGETELLFIDNHLQIVQMAYHQWKMKNEKLI